MMDAELLRDIDAFIGENREAIFRDIGRLVAVNSVEGEPESGAPFGRGPAEALALALELAKGLGLETRNCEDMIGYAQVGTGERYIATVTHLDVVPAGEGWSGDPFQMRERDGYIIGRGVMDNKGPLTLCLYALKYLRERGGPLRYPVRALMGINEETRMADVAYYLKNYPAPLFAFSPDAAFPLCNGEKGIYRGRVICRAAMENVVEISGGLAVNAVPDRAEATVRAGELSSAGSVSAEPLGDGLWRLCAKGVGGHASKPENTVNAIGLLVDYMLDKSVVTGAEADYYRLLSLLHEKTDGSTMGLAADDGRFEPLTLIGGTVGVKDGRVYQSVDCRYPTCLDGETIRGTLAGYAGDLAEVVTDMDAPPFYKAPDSPEVEACLQVYTEVTGEEARPFTMGGGTYAREFPNAISFGPEHNDRPLPAFAGDIHAADEAAGKEQLMEALKIYILALLRIETLEL